MHIYVLIIYHLEVRRQLHDVKRSQWRIDLNNKVSLVITSILSTYKPLMISILSQEDPTDILLKFMPKANHPLYDYIPNDIPSTADGGPSLLHYGLWKISHQSTSAPNDFARQFTSSASSDNPSVMIGVSGSGIILSSIYALWNPSLYIYMDICI